MFAIWNQARIYAQATRAANFQGRHIKKIEIEVWYAEKKAVYVTEI
jgi:hydroxymethylglutaryl-CoA reductase